MNSERPTHERMQSTREQFPIARIAEVAEEAIANETFPGCVVGIVRADDKRVITAHGSLRYGETHKSPVYAETIYDLASITKSIPVASLVARFIDNWRLDLDVPIAKYIPELQNHHDATINDLLTYRVHGPRLSLIKNKSADEMLAHIFANGFDAPPGESNYTNIPALLLGLVVERIGGQTLDVLAQEYFFDPLGMDNTTFFPDTSSNIAPTEIVDEVEVCGIVHDESARVFAREHKAVGHAGLFSTAPDLLNFLYALLHGDMPYVVGGAQKGIGWNTSGALLGTHSSSSGAFGKTGFTGTSVSVDIERGIAWCILSNRTYPKRPADASAARAFRAEIADVICAN